MLQTQKTRCSLQWDLTFFKQKLALLTAHHDPYHWSMCGISAPDKMKFCSKCDLACNIAQENAKQRIGKNHTKYPVTKLYHWGTLSFACQKDMMKFRENGNGNGNGPGHNTGLTSLHQITTCVIKLRCSRYPCLKGIITVMLSLHLRCSGRVDSIEESQDSWNSITVIRCHSASRCYMALECRCLL